MATGNGQGGSNGSSGFFNPGAGFRHGKSEQSDTAGQNMSTTAKPSQGFFKPHPSFFIGKAPAVNAPGTTQQPGTANKSHRTEFFNPGSDFRVGSAPPPPPNTRVPTPPGFAPASMMSPEQKAATVDATLKTSAIHAEKPPRTWGKGTATMPESAATLARTPAEYAKIQGALAELIPPEARKGWHSLAIKILFDLVHGKTITIGPVTRDAIGRALNEPVQGLTDGDRSALQALIGWGLGKLPTDVLHTAIVDMVAASKAEATPATTVPPVPATPAAPTEPEAVTMP